MHVFCGQDPQLHLVTALKQMIPHVCIHVTELMQKFLHPHMHLGIFSPSRVNRIFSNVMKKFYPMKGESG